MQHRLKQQYICPTDNEIVSRDDMVKGYEFAKDQYVTFTPDELKALEEKATGSIDIAEFVPLAEIDPVYFDRPYYLGPEKGGDKAYVLLARRCGRPAAAAARPLRRARQAVPGHAAPAATAARWCCSSCSTRTKSAASRRFRCPTAGERGRAEARQAAHRPDRVRDSSTRRIPATTSASGSRPTSRRRSRARTSRRPPSRRRARRSST